MSEPPLPVSAGGETAGLGSVTDRAALSKSAYISTDGARGLDFLSVAGEQKTNK